MSTPVDNDLQPTRKKKIGPAAIILIILAIAAVVAVVIFILQTMPETISDPLGDDHDGAETTTETTNTQMIAPQDTDTLELEGGTPVAP